MRIVWLIGYPLAHSLSPVIHNAAFEFAKINAIYIPIELTPNLLESTIKILRKPYTLGFNVTIPYKEKIMRYLDSMSQESSLIGAVNTVKYMNGKFIGYNTDSEGFICSLPEKIKKELTGKKAVIIGAGGGARAVTEALAKLKLQEIVIANRTLRRAKKVVKNISANFPKIKFSAIPLKQINETLHDSAVLVNASSVGLNRNDALLVKSSAIKSDLFVYDLIYNPKETKLLRIAKEKSCVTMNGIEMLIHQAALSWKIWFDIKAPIGVMEKAINDY